jgi:methionyl-tRNA synthetase
MNLRRDLNRIKSLPAVISSSVERYRFREALGELMNVARLGNKYLADEEPWKVIKDNPERVQMYVALNCSRFESLYANRSCLHC